MLLVFCPFAAGYFLSFFFRNVNAVISKDLVREFSLAPSDLGFLTSMYLLAFAAFQLPLGVLLDRYGPRRVLAVLYSIAGAGALIFGLAQDFTTLSIGRALIGLGVSGGLMGAIKAFTMWFPLSRLATLNGLYLAVGGIGGLSATAPVEALLGPLGWRALFYCVAGLSVLAAALIFFVVPEKPPPGRGETLATQIRRFGEIFATQKFWRIALPLVVCHAGYQALQGLWLGPWLYDVAELPRAAVANYLLVTAIAFTVGSVFFGVTSDRLAAAGVSHDDVQARADRFARDVRPARGRRENRTARHSRGVRLHRDLRRARLRVAHAAVRTGDDRARQHGIERADVRLLVPVPVGHWRRAAGVPGA